LYLIYAQQQACGRRELKPNHLGPRYHWVKLKLCEVASFASQPHGGHPNGYEQNSA